MKRLILSGLSVLLMSAATVPAVQAQVTTLGTPSSPAANPAAEPGSRIAPGTPGAPTTNDGTMSQQTPTARPKSTMPQETTTFPGFLGTPSSPAANPAAEPGSRIAPSTPGAPTTNDGTMPR